MQIIIMYIQNHYVKNNYMPLHKLKWAKNTSYQFKKRKNMYISKCLFVFFVLFFYSQRLPPPHPFTNPRYARAQTHMLVHELLTLEHSDKQMSLWLV